MAHESCKSQIAVLWMNGQSVPQRLTSMCEGSNTARRQCSAWTRTSSCPRFAERRFWRPGSLAAGRHIVDKQFSAIPWRHLNIWTKGLIRLKLRPQGRQCKNFGSRRGRLNKLAGTLYRLTLYKPHITTGLRTLFIVFPSSFFLITVYRKPVYFVKPETRV